MACFIIIVCLAWADGCKRRQQEMEDARRQQQEQQAMQALRRQQQQGTSGRNLGDTSLRHSGGGGIANETEATENVFHLEVNNYDSKTLAAALDSADGMRMLRRVNSSVSLSSINTHEQDALLLEEYQRKQEQAADESSTTGMTMGFFFKTVGEEVDELSNGKEPEVMNEQEPRPHKDKKLEKPQRRGLTGSIMEVGLMQCQQTQDQHGQEQELRSSL
ncbi:hypothetical protein ACA910_010955 [Epithemia clementina (nom. ined.)]